MESRTWVKIDYRDGLVDFLYDPNRLPKQIKLNKCPAQECWKTQVLGGLAEC